MQNLIILYLIVVVINVFLVFNFTVKLVGVETKKIFISNAIFQIINLLPKCIGIFQVPLLTLYTEYAINLNKPIDTFYYQAVILSGLIGILIGFILLPFFINSLKESINSIYNNNSFKIIFNLQSLKIIASSFLSANFFLFFKGHKLYKIKNRKLFSYNLIVSFLFCSAFPACILAGYYIPEYRATINSMVSLFNGIAAFVIILFIDTKLSVMTDKTLHNKMTYLDYKDVIFDCLKGKIIGTFIGIITLPTLSSGIVYLISKLI